MLKILIVDDEILIRANIKMLLDWESYGFLIIGEASDGKSALQLIERDVPDIVILDIKMPLMDGYELSTIISQKYKSIKMIILSNYDDFEYVKGTLKNGAVDYILKHTLNKEILLDSLNRVKSSLKAGNKNVSEFRTLNNIITLREKFIQQLLARLYIDNEEIAKQIQLLEIEVADNNILPVVMEIDDYEIMTTTDSSALKSNSVLDFAIVNITNELLSERKNGIITHILNKYFCILLSFSDVRSEARIQSSTDFILGTVSSCLNKFLQVSVSFSVGTLCNEFRQIPDSYDYAIEGLKNKFYLGKNCIIRNNTRNIIQEDLSGLSIDIEKQILQCIKSKNFISLECILKSVFSSIKARNFTVSSARIIFYDLLNIIINICKEKNVELSKLFAAGLTPQEKVTAIETIDEFESWILPIFKSLIESDAANELRYSPYVNRTISFINKNFSKNISLSDVAEEIKIGSTYLSKLFKDEVGVGFAEYLGNLRIDYAKVLLEDDRYKIKDILSKCGFNNYDYFIKAFKKKVGVTPKEYINNCKKH